MDEGGLRGLLAAGEIDAAFQLLHAAHGDEVRRFIAARRSSGVDDVAQEVWTAVGRTLARFRFEASPRGWILSIARRKLIDAWREEDPVVGLGDELADDPAVIEAAGAVSSPRSKVLREERRAAVQRALASLEADEREMLELRYVTGLKPGEIAEVLGERANTVSQRLVRALRRLRAAIVADEVFASRRES
jgi:RNA polymerase sigma-70 factor (ECF subfamily)